MSLITSHVLDSALGTPARGVTIDLLDDAGTVIASGITNADGRVGDLGPESLDPGTYRLRFHTGAYFGDRPTFYPEITIAFTVAGDPHYHVPILLGPYGFTTYRGS